MNDRVNAGKLAAAKSELLLIAMPNRAAGLRLGKEDRRVIQANKDYSIGGGNGYMGVVETQVPRKGFMENRHKRRASNDAVEEGRKTKKDERTGFGSMFL